MTEKSKPKIKKGSKQDEKKPQETALASGASQGQDEIDRFPIRMERYSIAKSRSMEMEDYLNSIGEAGLAFKLANCANYLRFHQYYSVGKVRLISANFCKISLLDPLCAIRRGSKALSAYLERYLLVKSKNVELRTSLVSLTVKNGPDLEERFSHLQEGLRILNQRRKDALKKKATRSVWSKVLGDTGSYEVTYSKRYFWHPHCHLIVLHAEDLSEKELRKEWFEITGDSNQVDISPIKHPDEPAKDFVEIFKYNLKYSSMTLNLNYQAYQILKGRRLLFSHGLLFGVKVPKSLEDEPLHNLPYIELFYRYYRDVGYSLESSKFKDVA